MIKRKIIYTISHSCCDKRYDDKASDPWVVTIEDAETYKNKPRNTLARWFDRRYSANIDELSDRAYKNAYEDCDKKGGKNSDKVELCPEGVTIKIEFEQYKNTKRTKYDRYPTIRMRNDDYESE